MYYKTVQLKICKLFLSRFLTYSSLPFTHWTDHIFTELQFSLFAIVQIL